MLEGCRNRTIASASWPWNFPIGRPSLGFTVSSTKKRWDHWSNAMTWWVLENSVSFNNVTQCVKLTWLWERFSDLAENLSDFERETHSQGYILHLIGVLLMSDKSNNRVHFMCCWGTSTMQISKGWDLNYADTNLLA